MRAETSLVALTGLFLFAGYGVLAAAGTPLRRGRELLAAAGLAYLCGLSATVLTVIVLLCLAVPANLPVFAATGLAIGLGGLTAGVRRHGAVLPARPVRAGRRLAGSARKLARPRWATGIGILLGVVALLGLRWAQVMPLSAWDAWSIWARKAELLFNYGTVPAGFFTSHAYAFMHPDYPLLIPVLESEWFRLMGSAATQSVHVEFWLLLLASVSAAAYVAARFARARVWAPLVLFVVVSPTVDGQLMTMYADIPMALLLFVGVLLLGSWVVKAQPANLALATLLLAAAASTKNEGLTAALCALVAGGAAVAWPGLPDRRVRLRGLLRALVGFSVIVAPWRIWLAAHHITGDMPIGKGLDPSYLARRSGRLGPAIHALYGQVTNPSSWAYLLPIALAVAIAALRRDRLRRISAFYLAAGLGTSATVLWAYVINPNEIHWYLQTSASRTVDGLMLIAAAGLVHLASLGMTPRTAISPDDAESTGSKPVSDQHLPVRALEMPGVPSAQP